MSPAKKKSLLEEIFLVGKAVSVSLMLLGLLGTVFWQVYAKDLVDGQVDIKMDAHAKEVGIYVEQIKCNAKDIGQLKELSMQTHLLIKQLTTDEMEKTADREFNEIKRRQ